jgi:NAD dependent epimerase/dehydratase family enzyme
LTSPNPVSNAEFTSALAQAVHRPAVMIVPVPALKLAVGGVSSDILSSARVLPRKLLDAGHQFQHAGIDGALAAELG